MSNTKQPVAVKSTQESGFNQAISLLTTSGTLELNVLSVGASAEWVLPLTLVLATVPLSAEDISKHQVTWEGTTYSLAKVTTQTNFSFALIIEGMQDELRYAIPLKEVPYARKIRISALKDIDDVKDLVKDSSKNKYVYQYVQHEDQIWIVPDLEALELIIKKH